MRGVMETFQTVFSFLGGWHMIADVLKNHGGPMAKEKIQEILKDNPRADLVRVLLTISKKDADKVWENIGAAKRGGWWENDVIVLLGHLIPRKEGGAIDEDRAKKLYKDISALGDKEFFRMLEALQHNPFSQKIKEYWERGKDVLEAVVEVAALYAGKTDGSLENWAARKQQEIETKKKTGWFNRLASRMP